ncbi:MAG: hypothetical protein NZ528_12995 [Caldilineales bacterium]|nr:hypothetical protein [Caldilineales bacterium]MDW8317498.1 hypothetical protein [Anaerolineae bacterium]
MDTLRIALGFALILFGLSYPLLTLFHINRQMNREGLPPRRQLVLVLALSALWPLASVLAGFWLLNERARQSPVYLGALLSSIFLLVVVLLLSRRAGDR